MNSQATPLPHPRHSVEALGIQTSYYEAGGPGRRPVILLHGMSASADSFRELMYALAGEAWLLAPDIPGFGYSEDLAPYTFSHLEGWLDAFLDALEIESAHLVGHSFGGALAVSFAISHPEHARSLILLAPSVLRPGKYPDWVRNLSQSAIADKVLELGVSASRLWLARQMRAAFYEPGRFQDSLWERRALDYEQSRASAGVLKASALHDVSKQLGQIAQPSLVIWGENDPVLDPADALRVAQKMTRSPTTLHTVAECGHIPQIEQTEITARLIREFVDEHFEEDPPAYAALPFLSWRSQVEQPIISVFGSSAPQPGTEAYEQARMVGRLVAEAGYAVATGGYGGTMAAVSQGAAEAGGHVIGVGCRRIEQFRPGGLNEWVSEPVQYEALQERLLHLVRHNDGMIVLPGGIGTMSELALAWSFLQVGEINSRPLVLLGQTWQETLQSFVQSDYVREPDAALLRYADTPAEAVALLQEVDKA